MKRRNMEAPKPLEVHVFDEDEVCLSNGKDFRCGLVTESYTYSSESEDEEDGGASKGYVRVAWHPEGKEERVHQNDLSLIDRSLMPGDMVRRIKEWNGPPRGYVRFTDVVCHAQIIGTSKVITSISSKDLQPLQFWDLSPSPRYVLLDSWLGRVENVGLDVTVRFPDGARCTYKENAGEIFQLQDVMQKRSSEFYKSVFYPGQELRGALREIYNPTWVNTTKAYNAKTVTERSTKKVTVTVEQVETAVVTVEWLCCGSVRADSSQAKMKTPPRNLKKSLIKRLKPVNIFDSCSTQLGDRFFYTIKDTDTILDLSSKMKKNLIHYVLNGEDEPENSAEENESNQQPCDSNQKSDNPESCAEAANTDSVTDMTNGCVDSTEYENVSDDSDVESTSSAHSNASSGKKGKKKKKGPLLQTKLMKNKGKRARRKSEPPASPKRTNSGDRVAVEVLHTSTCVEVMWQDSTIEKNIPSTDLFPIHHVEDTDMFFPGDLVLPNNEGYTAGEEYGMVGSVDFAGRTCMVTWRKSKDSYEINPNHEIICDEETNGKQYYIVKEEVSAYDLKEHPDYRFRPGDVVIRIGAGLGADEEAAGQVHELNTDGTLNVKWPNGTISSCRPWQIFLVGDDMSDLDESDWDSTDTESTDSWETESETELDTEEPPTENNIDKEEEVEKKVEQIGAKELLEWVEESSKRVAIAFNHNTALDEYFVDCYREILRIYRSCKRLDRVMETSFFRDSKLLSAINDIKDDFPDARENRLYKMQDIHEKLKSLEKVYGEYQKTKTTEGKGGGDADSDLKPQSVDGAGAAVNAVESELCEMLDSVLSCPADTSASVTASGDAQSSTKNTEDQVRLPAETAAPTESGDNKDHGEGEHLTNSDMSPASHKTSGATVQRDSDEDDPDEISPEAARAREIKLCNMRARRLCDQALKILKERIHSINAELEKRWHRVEKMKQESGGDVSADKMEAEAATSGGGDENEAHGSDTTGEAADNSSSTTEAETCHKILLDREGFTLLDSVPESHKYAKTEHHPVCRKMFFSSVKKELRLLSTTLPKGIIVKGYEDRMDLFSVMIVGPEKTPYEDGLFFFEVQLPNDYPSSPPLVHYLSFCSGQLNPNLYEDGKVCVSLLGTWTGKGNETWTIHSNLLQVLVSIQGLILVSEPYYNEAGYEKQRGSVQAAENSRAYNEMAIIKMQQVMNKVIVNPPAVFQEEVLEHYRQTSSRMIERLKHWMSCTDSNSPAEGATAADAKQAANIDFPLVPVSKGFCITLMRHLSAFQSVLKSMNIS